MRKSPESSPASSATTKDKFQGLLKNLEDAIQERRPQTESAIRDGASSIENALRVMFSSCTGSTETTVADRTASSLSSSSQQLSKSLASSTLHKSKKTPTTPFQKKSSMASQKQDLGEHIYAQLFFDDQIRAAKAVTSLRETEQERQQQPQASPPISATRTTSMPPLATAELDINRDLTFDDSISAISAHTLEAMASQHSTPPIVTPSPLCERSRSNTSKTSASTAKTSHSSDSFHQWQQQESKYWRKAQKEEREEKRVSRLLRLKAEQLRGLDNPVVSPTHEILQFDASGLYHYDQEEVDSLGEI